MTKDREEVRNSSQVLSVLELSRTSLHHIQKTFSHRSWKVQSIHSETNVLGDEIFTQFSAPTFNSSLSSFLIVTSFSKPNILIFYNYLIIERKSEKGKKFGLKYLGFLFYFCYNLGNLPKLHLKFSTSQKIKRQTKVIYLL